MRSSSETYQEVAKQCSSYEKYEKAEAFSNKDQDSSSCLNCKHFSKNEYCVLDLYDPIVENLK